MKIIFSGPYSCSKKHRLQKLSRLGSYNLSENHRLRKIAQLVSLVTKNLLLESNCYKIKFMIL